MAEIPLEDTPIYARLAQEYEAKALYDIYFAEREDEPPFKVKGWKKIT